MTTHGCASGGGMTRGRLLILLARCSTQTGNVHRRRGRRRDREPWKRYTRVGASMHANTNATPTAACPPILLLFHPHTHNHPHHPLLILARPLLTTPMFARNRLPTATRSNRGGASAASRSAAWPHNAAHAHHSSAPAPSLSPASDSFGSLSPSRSPPASVHQSIALCFARAFSPSVLFLAGNRAECNVLLCDAALAGFSARRRLVCSLQLMRHPSGRSSP